MAFVATRCYTFNVMVGKLYELPLTISAWEGLIKQWPKEQKEKTKILHKSRLNDNHNVHVSGKLQCDLQTSDDRYYYNK